MQRLCVERQSSGGGKMLADKRRHCPRRRLAITAFSLFASFSRFVLLLRAVLTGTQLLAASHADDQWGVLAGDSLDAADSMEGRRAALEFLGAAAAAMSTFLQHSRM